MSKTILFIQAQGRPGAVEIELAAGASVGDLHAALAAAGIPVDAGTTVFLDEAEEPLGGPHEQLPDVKRGSRVHVCRCHRVCCTAHYLDKTAERAFPPGVRVRAVKAWAV